MAELVYMLCAVTSFACALLLFRSYRRHPTRLLLWSAISFAFFTVNNCLLFADLILLPNLNLLLLRSLFLLIAVSVMLYGLIWEIA